MEAWSLHMLSVTMIALDRIDEAASRLAPCRCAHFRDARDLAGLTLGFDALAAVAVARGDERSRRAPLGRWPASSSG